MLTKTNIAAGLLVLLGTAPSAFATTPGPGGQCTSTSCSGSINLPGTPGPTTPSAPDDDTIPVDYGTYKPPPEFDGTEATCTANGGVFAPGVGGTAGGGVPMCVIPNTPPGTPGAPGVPTLTPAQVALMARNQIAITKPQIKTAPCTDAGCMGAVGVPVWLWVDGGLPTRTATATAGGLSVTVTARMSSVTWNLGDGTTVRCGAGTPYNRSIGWAESPDCGHKYTKASSTTASGKYAISANATWIVNFTGDFVDTQTIQASRTVNAVIGEYQAVVS